MLRRPRGRIGFAVAGTLVVGLIAVGVALGDMSFADPTGDPTGGAPDITQVRVSDDAAGAVEFVVTTVAPITADSDVVIVIDSDANPATGSDGAEYLLYWSLVAGVEVDKWNGSSFVDTGATLRILQSGNTAELTVARQDIGNPTRFGFIAATVRYDASDNYLGEDNAPDGGFFTYSIALPQCSNGKDDDGDSRIDDKDFGCSSAADNLESDDPVTLKAGKAGAFPAKGRAGKFVVVAAPVLRVETGKLITSGTVKCAARIGTKALRGIGRVVSGNAACGFNVPKSAKGKTARGTITVTHLGKKKVVPFAFKVN